MASSFRHRRVEHHNCALDEWHILFTSSDAEPSVLAVVQLQPQRLPMHSVGDHGKQLRINGSIGEDELPALVVAKLNQCLLVFLLFFNKRGNSERTLPIPTPRSEAKEVHKMNGTALAI